MKECCLCKSSEGELVSYPGYWGAKKYIEAACGPLWGHPACIKEAVYEMQSIDADCNDCIHFQRGAPIEMRLPDAKKVEHVLNIGSHGFCLKKQIPTKAYPKTWTGHECFEHRRVAEYA